MRILVKEFSIETPVYSDMALRFSAVTTGKQEWHELERFYRAATSGHDIEILLVRVVKDRPEPAPRLLKPPPRDLLTPP